MKNMLGLVAWLSLPIFALDPVTANLPIIITQPVLSGDCTNDDIRVVLEDGEYYIAAFFNDMDAVAEDKVIDKKRCTMKYNVQLSYGLKLDVFQFSVDGVYQLSENGTARLTVSHRVVNNSSARTTKFYSASQGDPLLGDIQDFTGEVFASEIPFSYRQCGSTIPLTTSIYAEAVKPSSDLTGFSRVSLDEGVTSGYVKLCRIAINPCQHP